MLTLWMVLLFMLGVAIGIVALPFFKNNALKIKHFFIYSFFIFFVPLFLYVFLGNSVNLAEWNNHGREHYQLLAEYQQLGGIDGIISRIQKKLAASPNDANGWRILGKLYRIKKENQKAKEAFDKAKKIEIDHHNQPTGI